MLQLQSLRTGTPHYLPGSQNTALRCLTRISPPILVPCMCIVLQTGGSLLHRIHKPYALELLLAVYYAAMGAMAGVYRSWIMVGYCGLMTLVFLVISFGDGYM